MRVKVEGENALKSALLKVARTVTQDEANRIAKEAAQEIVLVSAQEKVPVKTGRLKSSLAVREETNGASVETDVFYAPFVEFGTVKTPAQPYLFPAVWDNKQEILDLFKERLSEALK